MSSTGISRIEGLDPSTAIKSPCHVATTTNITLSGSQTIDGVAVVETTPKTRVLVKDQTDSTQNGIYDVYTTAWVRSSDFNGARDVVDSTLISVDSGSTYADTTWRVSATNPVVIGTSAIIFTITLDLGSTIGIVPTFAALASTAATVGQIVTIRCHTSGVIGAGQFEAVTGSVTNDGGTQINSATAGIYWKRIRSDLNCGMFGIEGDYVSDQTSKMTAAHALGEVVHYPRGHYKFTKFSIPTGGIIGEGKLTVFESTDTTSDNLITYEGDLVSIIPNNEGGAIFKDFYMQVATYNQKSGGAAIAFLSTPEENYTSHIDNVTILNIPTCVYGSLASYLFISNCYFHFYSVYGVYLDNGTGAFKDNGDNVISGNNFYTALAASSTATAIKYRAGGAKIFGNKLNGGQLGIDVDPIADSSIILAYGNSIENHTVNAIRFYTDPSTTATDYTQLNIFGNQIGGYNLTGPAISINPSVFTVSNVKIAGNTILNHSTGTNAIDIRNCTRFVVNDNIIDCQNIGYGGIFVDSTASNGKVINNEVHRFIVAGYHTLINSTTCPEIRLVATYSGTQNIPGILTLAQYTISGLSVPGAVMGDKVEFTFSLALQALTLTGYISAANTAVAVFSNISASTVTLGSGTLRARVYKMT